LAESAGKEDPATQPRLSGRSWSKVGGMYLRPKDSNTAVRVCDRATGKALEGADIQTDRQTLHAL